MKKDNTRAISCFYYKRYLFGYLDVSLVTQPQFIDSVSEKRIYPEKAVDESPFLREDKKYMYIYIYMSVFKF